MVRLRLWKQSPVCLAIAGVACASLTPNQPFHSLTRRNSTFPQYDAHNISVPIDHFHNDTIYEPHSDGQFPLRYWFDSQYYREGGPVIILASGEADGEGRLTYLDHGIVAKLAEATGGIAVVLEHRYYGQSYPVPDLGAENMRFLSTEQALADTEYFARHVQFPGLEDHNLTAPATPFIIYGGSYAGAFAAFARKIYPETFWGAIASSAVTQAIVDYWEYYEAARLFAPGPCAIITQKLTHIIDNILLGEDSGTAKRLKQAFGLGGFENADFANALTRGISMLQNTNWDPEVDYSGFGVYCASVSSNDVLFASTRHLGPYVERFIAGGGYGKEIDELTNHMLNYIGYIRKEVKETMASCKHETIEECVLDRAWMGRIDLEQGETRSWVYQTCTQWGYFQTGSGVPDDQLPLISRLIDLNYTTLGCRVAFNITDPPNVESINKLGGFNFSFPRVAFVDGTNDPWRAATPHRIGLPDRVSTDSEPFILIEHGVHHWDENALPQNQTGLDLPPPEVEAAQQAEIEFVQKSLEEWKKSRGTDEEADEATDDESLQDL